MTGGKLTVRVVLGTVAVCGVAASAVSVASLLSRATRTAAGDFHGVAALRLATDFEDVTVTEGAAAGSVSMRRSYSWSLRRPHIGAAVQGNTLRVSSGCWGIGRPCTGWARLNVPPGTPVTGGGGDGSVTLNGTRGAVDLSMSDGAVHGTDLRSPTVRVHTADGGVRLEFATAPQRVDVHTADAGVTVVVPRGVSWRVTTGTADGGVHVTVPQDPAATRTISVHTADGSITIANP